MSSIPQDGSTLWNLELGKEGTPGENEGRLSQFTKTRMCKFHILGKCTKGVQCPFAHEQRQLRELPDLRCTKLCKTLIQTGLCKNKSCTYAHTKEELRSTGAFHKTKLCRFMQTGHCSLGSKCNFAHSQVELREPVSIDGFEGPGIAWESVLGLLSDGENDRNYESGKSADKYASKHALIEEANPAYVSLPMATDPWNVSLEDRGIDSFWSYGQLPNSQVGVSDAYAFEGSDLGTTFFDCSGGWPGASFPSYTNQFGHNFLGFDGQLFGDNMVIDQKKEWKAKASRSANAAPKMRSVRTSESTLCTLGDSVQAFDTR